LRFDGFWGLTGFGVWRFLGLMVFGVIGFSVFSTISYFFDSFLPAKFSILERFVIKNAELFLMTLNKFYIKSTASDSFY